MSANTPNTDHTTHESLLAPEDRANDVPGGRGGETVAAATPVQSHTRHSQFVPVRVSDHGGETTASHVVAKRPTAKKGKSVKTLPLSPPHASARGEVGPTRGLNVIPNPRHVLLLPMNLMIVELPGDHRSTIAQVRANVCSHCDSQNLDCHQDSRATWACQACNDIDPESCSWVEGTYTR